MKRERPILFSTPMVQAILDGRKTQTRRTVKGYNDPRPPRTTITDFEDWHGRELKCPYGTVGDILWVRETFAKLLATNNRPFHAYKSDSPYQVDKWKPSIHMPKEVARIFLEITNVRIERLNDISERDAEAEGVDNWTFKDMAKPQNWMDYTCRSCPPLCSATDSFVSLWESINGEESWESNPWVWVIEFKRIEKP